MKKEMKKKTSQNRIQNEKTSQNRIQNEKTSQNRIQNDVEKQDLITLGYVHHSLLCVKADLEGLISHVALSDIAKFSRLVVLRQYASDLAHLTLSFREELKNNLLKK